MNTLSSELLHHVLKLSPDGIVVCERRPEGWPVVFANEAFEQLTGYSLQELQGRDLRMLQGEDRDQENVQKVRESLKGEAACRVIVRNYRKDGTQFWNEMSLLPVKDLTGQVSHFVGFHREAGDRLRAEMRASGVQGGGRDNFVNTGTYPALLSVLRDDRVTGLYNRGYFNEVLRRDWAISQREHRHIGLLMFDVDCLGVYNDTFGRQAGDACIKRVGRVISGCLRRGSDVTARWEGGTLVVLISGMTQEQVMGFTASILERVREQHIHHPRSAVQRYVTVSAGAVSVMPDANDKAEDLIESAQAALKQAKDHGRNQVMAGAWSAKGG